MRWPLEALWEQVVPFWPGFTAEVLPELDSTNSELMRRARSASGAPALSVIRCCWWPYTKPQGGGDWDVRG